MIIPTIVDPFPNNKKDIMTKLVGISLTTLLRFPIFETKLVWVCPYFLTAPSAGFIALPYVFNSCCGWRRHFLLAICINVSSLPLSFLENKTKLQELFLTQFHLMTGSVSQIIPMLEKEEE